MNNLLCILMLISFSFLSNCKTNSNRNTETIANANKSEIDISRFENEIKQFELQDRTSRYAPNSIILTGSSSIRMWSTLYDDMKELPVLNRGFGGSTLPEVLHFSDRFLYSIQPKIVVLYCGENDISEGDSPEIVFQNFVKLATKIKKELPESQLVFMSMKPSVARFSLWPKYQTGNQLIEDYVDMRNDMYYFDTSSSMLDSQGNIRKDIFVEDGLHMNAKGYDGWSERLYNLLKKLH